MNKLLKRNKVCIVVLAVVFVAAVAFLIVSAVTQVHRFFQEDSMTTEEWAAMMLTDYRDDVEAVIADMRERQEQGIKEVYIYKEGEAIKISLTSLTSHTTEILNGNTLYERLSKKCMSIQLHENGAISFSRRGFFTGYTGFYYSPAGIQLNIETSADWYETAWLEGNFFCYQFGY